MEEQVRRRCGRCGELVVPLLLECPPPHHRREVCPHCEQHMGWLKKPDSCKKRRESAHRELVAKYGKGFCEMCLMPEDDLNDRTYLVGHHVQQYADDGGNERENVWIVCNACHSLIHWARTHHGRSEVSNGTR